MPSWIGQALDIALRVKTEWGVPLFVIVSYTFTCLFTISQVRAIRLDRQYKKKKPKTETPDMTRMQIRATAFLIGAPMEFFIGYLWQIGNMQTLALHALIAGVSAPVVADIWIRVLYWRGCHEQAEIFKVGKRQRATDKDAGDETWETRL